MASQTKSVLHSLILLLLIVVKTSATISISPFYIFGDSTLDVGNNNYINTTITVKANFAPYGITFPHISKGRFCDGRVMCDFIAELANLPSIPPYLQPGNQPFYGVNFASGGAGALSETNQGFVISLQMQLRNYKAMQMKVIDNFGEVEASQMFSRAVNLFAIAKTDYVEYITSLLTSNSIITYTVPQYVNMVITNITSVVNEIYRTGGRKFAFLTVPQFACTPLARNLNAANGGVCLTQVSSFAILHNQALIQALQGLQQQLPGFQYSLYDLYTRILQITEEPQKYGFNEGKVACCGSGAFRGIFSCGRVPGYELCPDINDYLFWDSVHNTEKANKLFADEAWSCSNKALCLGPYSIQDLFH